MELVLRSLHYLSDRVSRTYLHYDRVSIAFGAKLLFNVIYHNNWWVGEVEIMTKRIWTKFLIYEKLLFTLTRGRVNKTIKIALTIRTAFPV